jgi:TolB protein
MKSMQRWIRGAGLAGALGMALPAAAAGLAFEGEAETLLPGVLSRKHNEVQASFHPGGKVVLFGCADCRGTRGGDLLEAQLRDGRWVGPGRAKPSLSANESAPAFTPEGGWLYYLSDHANGTGGTDLYRVAYSDVREQFSTPENLGPSINSPGDEGAASADAHGHHLVFASRGRDGARGWDLFESRRAGGRMTPAQPLAALNTRADEFDPALLAAGRGLVLARSEAGGSARWFAPAPRRGFGAPVRLPATVNAPGTAVRAPQQDHRDPAYLLFTRTGADGSSDVFRIRYRVAAEGEGDRAADDR